MLAKGTAICRLRQGGKSQNENAGLVSGQWLWPSNTTYKLCRANFFPSGSSYSMIDCISCANALDHIQNVYAELVCWACWCLKVTITSLGHASQPWKLWVTRKKDTLTYLVFRGCRLKKNVSSLKVLKSLVHLVDAIGFCKAPQHSVQQASGSKMTFGKGTQLTVNLGKWTSTLNPFLECDLRSFLPQLMETWHLGPSLLIFKFCLAEGVPSTKAVRSRRGTQATDCSFH